MSNLSDMLQGMRQGYLNNGWIRKKGYGRSLSADLNYGKIPG